jgi:hypothetical protein
MFLKLLCIACALAVSVLGINLSQTRSFLPSRRYLMDINETAIEEIYSDFKSDAAAESHRSGYLRLDTFDWLRGIWIQGQVLPIGVCFKEGFHGGSAMLSEVLLVSNSVFRTTKVYRSKDCKGEARMLPFIQPRNETSHQLEQTISHVESYDDAVALYPPGVSGLVVS